MHAAQSAGGGSGAAVCVRGLGDGTGAASLVCGRPVEERGAEDAARGPRNTGTAMIYPPHAADFEGRRRVRKRAVPQRLRGRRVAVWREERNRPSARRSTVAPRSSISPDIRRSGWEGSRDVHAGSSSFSRRASSLGKVMARPRSSDAPASVVVGEKAPRRVSF
ncbi:hypothetical protein BD413DRAFT_536198 [Trametes elegans]|nr:hypothetical protein BD413DRAFT_536198 [Trametes elegans]